MLIIKHENLFVGVQFYKPLNDILYTSLASKRVKFIISLDESSVSKNDSE